jgi:hypothetical protein
MASLSKALSIESFLVVFRSTTLPYFQVDALKTLLTTTSNIDFRRWSVLTAATVMPKSGPQGRDLLTNLPTVMRPQLVVTHIERSRNLRAAMVSRCRCRHHPKNRSACATTICSACAAVNPVTAILAGESITRNSIRPAVAWVFLPQ